MRENNFTQVSCVTVFYSPQSKFYISLVDIVSKNCEQKVHGHQVSLDSFAVEHTQSPVTFRCAGGVPSFEKKKKCGGGHFMHFGFKM